MKPRTNAETAQYWADSILDTEPAPAITVNSVIVRNDVIFSFGSHFPMAVILRDEQGRAHTVITNSDHWPSSGWGNTTGDQWSVRSAANEVVSRSRRKIELKSQLLSNSAGGRIQVRPRANDPEPPAHFSTEIPVPYVATDPGPEPVKSPEGCIAGERYGVSVWNGKTLAWTNDLREGDGRPVELAELPRERTQRTWSRERHVLAYIDAVLEGRELLWVGTWVTEWTEYGEPSYMHPAPEGARYEQCPHCKAFDAKHRAWTLRYHGESYGRNRGKGFKQYVAMLERFGSQEAWAKARNEDWHRVRNGRRVRKEWEDRNFIPFDAVTAERVNGISIPKLDSNGHAARKDADAYFKAERERERRHREEMRRLEREAIERRKVERFKARIRREREKNPSIEQLTGRVMRELSFINERLRPDDSQEVTP